MKHVAKGRRDVMFTVELAKKWNNLEFIEFKH